MNTPADPKRSTPNPKDDIEASRTAALYDRFAEKSRELFEAGQEKGHEEWEKAMDLARRQLAEAGEFSAEQGEVFKQYLRRDLAQTLEDMQRLGVEAREHLHPARVSAGALSTLSRLLHVTGNTLTRLSKKTEKALEYKTGEITMAGTLTCLKCGHTIQLKETSVVPSCPACKGNRFRKGY